jgi:hypothetical protein
MPHRDISEADRKAGHDLAIACLTSIQDRELDDVTDLTLMLNMISADQDVTRDALIWAVLTLSAVANGLLSRTDIEPFALLQDLASVEP